MSFNDKLVDNIHNPTWRLDNLYKITNKAKETIPFRLNYVQSLLAKSPTQWEAILKARQLGISTFYILKKLDKTIWNHNRTTCILAHEQDAIKKLFRIARFAYNNMPEAIKPEIAKGGGSMYEMYFPKVNSRIYCDLESRSDTISDLHVSEMAFVEKPDKVRATMDAVPIDTGEISIETTPNGLNHFFDSWNNKNWPFKRYFFPWFFDPSYRIKDSGIKNYTEDEWNLIKRAKLNYNINIDSDQIAFRRFKIAQKGKRHFMQEYPEDDSSCFLMSGTSAFEDLEAIKKWKLATLKPLFEINGLCVWEEFIRGEQYVIGADPAEGLIKGDWSAAAVLKRRTREQVASLRGKFKPKDFGHRLFDLGKLYTGPKTMPPRLAVERNNHGHAVLLKLEDLEYMNLFEDNDGRPGWKNSVVSRPLLMDNFIDAVENQLMTIRDDETFGECLTLVNNNGKIEALDGKHDDTIIANGLALMLCLDGGTSFSDNIVKM